MSLLSTLGKLGKFALGAVPGGGVAKQALRIAVNRSKPSASDSVVTARRVSLIPPSYESRTVQYDHSPVGAGGAAQASLQAASARCGFVTTDGRMRAQRLNKSTYVTRGGGTSRWPAGQLVLHPKGTECVTVRRRHVTNAKALRRAISRVRGFLKTYRKAAALLGHRGRSRSSRCARCGRNPCGCK